MRNGVLYGMRYSITIYSLIFLKIDYKKYNIYYKYNMSLSINLAASKIAGMVGMNPYYSVDEAKEELYCKVKK